MEKIDNVFQKLQSVVDAAVSQLSTSFMEVNNELLQSGASQSAQKKFNALYKSWLKTNQQINHESSVIQRVLKKMESALQSIKEEKKRLEILYTSGILFASETEMQSLMSKAIDTVIKELDADAGFIVLVNAEQEIENVFSRNMEPEKEPDALSLSTSVIENTIRTVSPTITDNLEKFQEDSKKGSIISLGIKSVICVPLISATRVLGAVYLDRREKGNAFQDSDLIFLISFARQIVQGLEISREIMMLEKRLLSDTQIKLEDLRREFVCPGIRGSSPKLLEVLITASKIAPTNASVIILGENGTGKELLARAIHHNSRRADKPFVTIDCSSIPSELMESELFGYESGAFTGATKAKPGKIEMANGGTLFLDEIGEMDINLQAKLLRVLQSQEIERLGGLQPSKVDVRIIAATNRDLKQMIREGNFREDLYYRLNVIQITMPPLRERKEDIEELATSFLEKYAPGRALTISPEAMEVLGNYHWYGNIRELENVIHRGIILTKNQVIDVSDLPPELTEEEKIEPIQPGKPLAEAEIEFRRRYILRTLKKCSSKREAAMKLGVNRTHFYRMLNQLGIDL
ncbi:MAG: sigma-54-dependent Fis family transcriptional regulator [Calditrichaeota bacterium]|nr:MAG: sigma-54-dependent Fis family transcriptional regulator [Calditrichota bacterium]